MVSFFGRNQRQAHLKNISCPKCGGPLIIQQVCPRIFICCDDCNGLYPVEDFAGAIDDELEERLADVPCNRI